MSAHLIREVEASTRSETIDACLLILDETGDLAVARAMMKMLKIRWDNLAQAQREAAIFTLQDADFNR